MKQLAAYYGIAISEVLAFRGQTQAG